MIINSSSWFYRGDASNLRTGNSELHGVRSITFGQRESGAEILLGHHIFADLSEDSGIDFLLELLSGISEGLLWSVFSEELLGFGSGSFALLLESLVGDVGLNSGNINAGRGSHGVSLVDSLDWDTVELVWASDGEESTLKLLEADDSLSLESSSEEDEDLTWSDTFSEFWSFWSVSLWGLLDIISWVPLEFLDHLKSKKQGIVRICQSMR